jgi:hypothetical protein
MLLTCRKCRNFLTTFASVASWLQSVANVVESYYHDDDTKEALETSHVLGLKEENWFTGVKHLLTPEKGFSIKSLEGERSPKTALGALALPYKASGAL